MILYLQSSSWDLVQSPKGRKSLFYRRIDPATNLSAKRSRERVRAAGQSIEYGVRYGLEITYIAKFNLSAHAHAQQRAGVAHQRAPTIARSAIAS